ncbi:MAG: hypothetical protein ACJAUV_001199 [Flavobacteriales bacterium]|jgi:hypothetical protein
MKYLIIIFSCFWSSFGYTQVNNKVIDLPITTCDCNGAIQLFDKPIGPMKSSHYGKELEIRNNASDDLYFLEREHFSSWFVVKAPFTGELILDIISEDASEDFNFLVFLASGRWFCNKLREGTEIPLRSNMSSTDRGMGITGLSLSAPEDYISSYDDDSFSSSIQMIAGDFYYIIVDNKRQTNKGFTIHARFLKPSELEEMDGHYQVDVKTKNRF